MTLSQGLVIAGRYQLVECLGTGAMGEVWRAQDTRFESRLVAVKFLREDETLKEDQLNRDRMIVRLDQQAVRGGISMTFALEAIASALGAGNIEGLRAKAESRLGAVGPYDPSGIVEVFDEVVKDPAFNENARMRAKLRRLFRDEANTVANLRHDNVVSIFDYGDHEGNPYLVMDYIEGRTLYQVVQGQEALPRSRRLQLMEDLCAGLGYAHRHKLVHRDIKPANLIIDASTGSLKILDFGVVRRLGSTSTVGVPVGTFCYMSPEQTRGSATLDHRSDIFAVGLVFYELMSGRKAFPPGKSIGDLVARIQRDAPPALSEIVPSLPRAIEDIINKAIEKQPENRYQDLSIMERDIAKLRARLEASEQSERTMMAGAGDSTVLKVKPAQASVTDLLDSAERAFETGDNHAAVEFCQRMLALQPGFAPALSLLARAEARQRETELRDVLQQTEKLLSLEELTSAKATLVRARVIDPSSPRIKAIEEKIDAALAAREAAVKEAERARLEVTRPLPIPTRKSSPSVPPAPPPDAQVQSPAPPPPSRPASATRLLIPTPFSRPQLDPPPPRLGRPPRFEPPPPRVEPSPPVTPPARPDSSRPSVPPSPVRPASPVPPPAAAAPPAPHAPPPPAPAAPAPQAPAARGSGVRPPPSPPPPARAAVPAPARPDQARTVPSVPTPAAPAPRARSMNWLGLAVVGGLLAVLVLSVAVLLLRAGWPLSSRSPQPGAPPESTAPAPSPPAPSAPSAVPVPAPTDTIPGPPPATASGPLTSVLIDLRPWARVTIVPAVPNAAIPADAFYAPFTIDLPAGDYTLECENGGVTRPATIPLKVVEGTPQQALIRPLPGFNAARTVDGLLSQEK